MKKHAILVVDDDESLRKVVARALERAGYEVLVASSGKHALMLADFSLSTIDLLIVDIELSPGMTGFELALEVRARRPGLPVLYMSGASPGPVEHFLPKPFSLAELIAKVEEMLEKGSGEAEGAPRW